MRTLVLALVSVLLVGCVSSTPQESTLPKNEQIAKLIDQVRGGVHVAGKLADLVCDLQTEESHLCKSLKSSWAMVVLALDNVDKLHATYVQTGLGIELVYQALEHVITTLDAMDSNAKSMRTLSHVFKHREIGRALGRAVLEPPSTLGIVSAEAAYPGRQSSLVAAAR